MRTAIIIACLAAGVACRPPSDPPLRPGDPFPALHGAAPTSGARLVWVLRPQDYLRCTTLAGPLRRLQSRHGERLPLTVLYVGEHPDWARAFLREQRISAEFVELSPQAYRRAFRRRAWPSLHLLDGGRVRRVSMMNDTHRMDPVLMDENERLVSGAESLGGGSNTINPTEEQS